MDKFYLGMITAAIVSVLAYENGFEAGQIAAINGDVQYKLVVTKDKSTSWVKIAK